MGFVSALSLIERNALRASGRRLRRRQNLKNNLPWQPITVVVSVLVLWSVFALGAVECRVSY